MVRDAAMKLHIGPEHGLGAALAWVLLPWFLLSGGTAPVMVSLAIGLFVGINLIHAIAQTHTSAYAIQLTARTRAITTAVAAGALLSMAVPSLDSLAAPYNQLPHLIALPIWVIVFALSVRPGPRRLLSSVTTLLLFIAAMAQLASGTVFLLLFGPLLLLTLRRQSTPRPLAAALFAISVIGPVLMMLLLWSAGPTHPTPWTLWTPSTASLPALAAPILVLGLLMADPLRLSLKGPGELDRPLWSLTTAFGALLVGVVFLAVGWAAFFPARAELGSLWALLLFAGAYPLLCLGALSFAPTPDTPNTKPGLPGALVVMALLGTTWGAQALPWVWTWWLPLVLILWIGSPSLRSRESIRPTTWICLCALAAVFLLNLWRLPSTLSQSLAIAASGVLIFWSIAEAGLEERL